MHKIPEAWLNEALQSLDKEAKRRQLVTYSHVGGILEDNNQHWLNLGSNDYLNLAGDQRLRTAAIEAVESFGTGSGASRLVTGTLPLHEQLEIQLATHKRFPAALTFGSGYMTNAGTIQALVGRSDHVLADRLIHASMIDAVRLSGARLHRFAHNDMQSLADQLERLPKGRRLILTESVFSMDGDLAPLKDIAALASHYEAMLMVDEAHAGGLYGPHGAGRIAEAKLQDDVTCGMGTFSKALGGYGGFVTCSQELREWLINKARAFIYTTAPPPSTVATAIAALNILAAEPALGSELLQRARHFRDRLQAAGLNTLHSDSAIVPIVIGENDAVLRIAQRLKDQHILVGAIRPPTVPTGTARLRCSITLAHTKSDLDFAADQIIAACEHEAIP